MVTPPHTPQISTHPRDGSQLPFYRLGVNLLALVNGFWVSGPISHLSLSFISEEASCLQLEPLTSRKGNQETQTFPASPPLHLSRPSVSVACLPHHTHANPCGPTRHRLAAKPLHIRQRDGGTEGQRKRSPRALANCVCPCVKRLPSPSHPYLRGLEPLVPRYPLSCEYALKSNIETGHSVASTPRMSGGQGHPHHQGSPPEEVDAGKFLHSRVLGEESQDPMQGSPATSWRLGQRHWEHTGVAQAASLPGMAGHG